MLNYDRSADVYKRVAVAEYNAAVMRDGIVPQIHVQNKSTGLPIS